MIKIGDNMREENDNKKAIFYTAVFIMTLIALIVGATMSYLSLIASQKEEGTQLYTGTLEISYIDGTYVKNPVLYPLSSVSYDTKESVYRNSFSIQSNGTLDQVIDIDLDITQNEFQKDALKYAVFNMEGTKLEEGFLPQSGKVNLASNIFLGHGNAATYTIIIWWDSKGNNQQLDAGHFIFGKITAYARQIKK